MKRQIALDTETTGLEVKDGHRIIEIGCIEMIERKITGNSLHLHINPEREIDEGAAQVHGITLAKLKDKPKFADIRLEFINFIEGAELLIHNAPFDLGFINYEFSLVDEKLKLENICEITDTLQLARDKYPRKKNNLDALCTRLNIDNSNRELHGALIDSRILAEVYLAMTGGQIDLALDFGDDDVAEKTEYQRPENGFVIIRAGENELAAHNDFCAKYLTQG